MKKVASLLLACLLMVQLALPASAVRSIQEMYQKYGVPRSSDQYVNVYSGTSLEVPPEWTIDDHYDGTMTFENTGDKSVLMTFQAVDLKVPGACNDDFSKKEFAEVLGVKSQDLKSVTLGDREYYTAQSTVKKTVQGVKVSLTINAWVIVEDGWIYIYHFAASKNHELYEPFTKMIASAAYGKYTPNQDFSGPDPSPAAPATEQIDWLGGSYSGDMEDGEPQGQGTLRWDSSYYEGHFENGYPKGSGTFYFNDCTSKTGSDWGWTSDSYLSWLPERQGGDMYYTGMTLGGNPWGYGVLDFCSGGAFEGEFRYGDPDGKGVYTYYHPSSEKNKTISGDGWITVCAENRLKNEYHGLKLDGKWQGFGIGILKSGYAYCGEIRNDYRDGYGELYTKKDKLERYGLYKKGEYVQKIDRPDK